MTNRITLSAGIAAVALSSPATAATVGTTLPVTALTVNTCAVVATSVVFGVLNQLGGVSNDSQGNVTVTCTPGTTYDVGLDNGAHAVSGVRYMMPAVGTAAIPYSLSTNAGRSTAWGNTVGTNTVSGTAGVLPATLTVYGRVPGSATPVAANAYTDLVTVTVTF